jgi:hypothetical protein
LDARTVRIVEDRHPGEPAWLWRLGNLTAIDSERVRSIGVAWLFKEDEKWRLIPRLTGNESLFYNAAFFLRLAVPFGLFASLRWSSSSTGRALIQTGAGWALNGRLKLLLRVQSDASSAAGSSGPNTGQATGFGYGTH